MPVYTVRNPTKQNVAANVEEAVLEVATPATRRARLLRVSWSPHGVTVSHLPTRLRLSYFDVGATGGLSVTPQKHEPGETPSLMTCKEGFAGIGSTNRVDIVDVSIAPTSHYERTWLDGAEDQPKVPISKFLELTAHADTGAFQEYLCELTWAE